jgi:4-hydroxybenzoate polyprenyltransferase
MKKVKGFFRLIRIGASAFAAVHTVIAGLLAGDLRGFQIEHLAAFGIVLLTAAGAFAFNDYFDYESDRLNRRTDRPLVQGVLPRKVALITGILAFAIAAVLLSLQFPLQNILLIKNLIVAYAYTASIFPGALVSDGLLEPLILYFAVMGFIVGLGFEIMLDTRDIKGDSIVGTHTLATRFGTAAYLIGVLV